MFFINDALANDKAAIPSETPSSPTVAITSTPSDAGGTPVPAPADAVMMNIGMVLVLGVLFYLLLIRPQQKRFKEHADMIGKMDKGSKVVTQGGLVGTIEKIVSDHEVVIDFGNNVKMTMMRSYILGRYEDSMPSLKVANDDSKKKDKNSK